MRARLLYFLELPTFAYQIEKYMKKIVPAGRRMRRKEESAAMALKKRKTEAESRMQTISWEDACRKACQGQL